MKEIAEEASIVRILQTHAMHRVDGGDRAGKHGQEKKR